MLSIDCRALLKHTFYGGSDKTHPDILLLRVRALYSKGEMLLVVAVITNDTD